MTARLAVGERLEQRSVSKPRNAGLAIVGEDLPHRAAGALLDDRVAVDQPPAEPLGDDAPHGGLAGSHQPDEDDVLIRLRSPRR